MIDLNNPEHRNNVEWSDGQPAKVGQPIDGLFPVTRNNCLGNPYFVACRPDGTSREISNSLRLKTPRIDWNKPLRMQGSHKSKVTKTEPQEGGTIKVTFEDADWRWYTEEGLLSGYESCPTNARHLVNYTPQYRSLNAEEMEALVGTSVWCRGGKQVITGYRLSDAKVWLLHENKWVSADWLRKNATYDKEGTQPVAVEV